MWQAVESGATIGTTGSEGGIIIYDEEHPDGAQITLERDAATEPFVITCNISGTMVHSCYYNSIEDAEKFYENIKTELTWLLDLIPPADDPDVQERLDHFYRAMSDFVERY